MCIVKRSEVLSQLTSFGGKCCIALLTSSALQSIASIKYICDIAVQLCWQVRSSLFSERGRLNMSVIVTLLGACV